MSIPTNVRHFLHREDFKQVSVLLATSVVIGTYLIVASSNKCYQLKNQLFVKRSHYIRTENPLHKQSEKSQHVLLNETC